ncbi:lytic transglycosylase domain-containing protein [Methylophaga lonarensis]|uniref:lytic transglycosylase domain-containing protein n=1 Tax=Methylophaga lonarensis TaxID=999151 RepID=UPI001F2A631C|nr:lytic transglycosylase domain-containing protein [Methylophaga lonarensis]
MSLLNQLPAEPPRGDQISLARDLPLSREILVHGITRLARQNPEQAFEVWQRLSPHYNFDQSQYEHVRREAGKWSALKREDAALGLFGEVGDEPWKVRAALWQQNWPAVQDAIQSLNEEERQLNRWQYWLARSEAELGRYESAQAIYARIAGERDFYSFMAADRLEQPYQMNHNPILSDAATMQAFRQNIEVRRLEEFVHLNLDLEARRQIFRATQTFTPEQLQLLAVITHDMQWHHQTIAILGRARYWDALDLRFPVLYQAPMQRAAKANRLDSSWLLAIARQESAFQEQVRSHAGAMGLMQVMPDTGRAVANRLNDPLKNVNELNQPERNIQLGSAYLRQMLDRNQNNPILATAAYNAGPHRIDRWLPEQTLPADIWIENIPFNETRRYVRAVMSYAAIYDYQQQLEITPLKQRMPAVQPKKP